VISLPPNVNLPDFDEAIQWMEQGTIRQLNRRTDRGLCGSQFVAAAVACMASASGALGIPAKLNAHSETKPSGIPG
jgi:hypothetical protein